MKKYSLKEKCGAATQEGVKAFARGMSLAEVKERFQCKNGGTQRHSDADGRYALCGQHANMVMEGKFVLFVAKITPEVIASAVNAQRLPGMDTNVTTAREALGDTPTYMEVEIFYVRGLEPGKVLLLHKEVITNITRWSKAIIMIEAMHHMPNIEGKVTGIMARSGNNKAVWNRKSNGWVPRPVPTNLTIVTINNEENK